MQRHSGSPPVSPPLVTGALSPPSLAAERRRIFQEFSQVEHPIQKRVRGSGLGLPLATRLAELLGGRVSVESQPGVGSTFSAVIPVSYVESAPAPVTADRIAEPDPTAREGAAVVLQAVTRARTAAEDARG